jgi:hypothetical protein
MPYSNEHAARLADPETFDSMRRENDKYGPGIDVIWGIKAGQPVKMQAIRFAREKFTAEEARAWLREHHLKSIAFEPALTVQTNAHSVQGEIEVLASLVRRETFQGREHIVAPVVMLVEGVHRGLYYPADEIALDPHAWNGIPVTVNHPMVNGVPVSANDPGIIESSGVGQIFNTRWDGKLRSEAWIDVARAEKVAPEILRALADGSGAALEVSTGLYTDEDGRSGRWNGKDYRATVRDYRPNHLALLPNGQGACNWADGCGIRLNEEADHAEMIPATSAVVFDRVPTAPEAAGLRAAAEVLGLTILSMDGPESPGDGQEAPVQVTGAEDGTPEPAASLPSLDGAVQGEESREMERNEAITKLIECECSRFVVNDRPFLETLTDEQLTAALALEPVKAVEPPPTPQAQPATPEPAAPRDEFKPPITPTILTADQYVAQAPAAVAGVLRRALAREQAEKDSLVAALVANERNRFPETALREKDIEELKAMTDLAAITVNYAGQSGGPAPRMAKTGPPPMPLVFEMKD